MKRIIAIFTAILFLVATAYASENSNMEGHRVVVTAKLLNGRLNPSKGAMKTAFFDKGDDIELTGWWSDDHNWVEVYAGEAGACWVARQYVTERTDTFMVINTEYNKVKIRKKPSDNARVTGYLRKGREVEITQVLLGWGKCSLGWIDLYYVQEED